MESFIENAPFLDKSHRSKWVIKKYDQWLESILDRKDKKHTRRRLEAGTTEQYLKPTKKYRSKNQLNRSFSQRLKEKVSCSYEGRGLLPSSSFFKHFPTKRLHIWVPLTLLRDPEDQVLHCIYSDDKGMLHKGLYTIGDPGLTTKLVSSFAIKGAEDPNQNKPIAVLKISSCKGNQNQTRAVQTHADLHGAINMLLDGQPYSTNQESACPSESSEAFLLQQYIKPKGQGAWMVRVVWRAGGDSYAWIFKDPDPYFTSEARSVVKSVGRAWSTPKVILDILVSGLESSLQVSFSEFVGDFLEDASGRWFLLQVKGFKILHQTKSSAIVYKKRNKHTVPGVIGKEGPPCGWCKAGPSQWPVKSREFMLLDFSKIKEEENKGGQAGDQEEPIWNIESDFMSSLSRRQVLRLYDVLMVCEKCKRFYDDYVKGLIGKKKKMKPLLESITKKNLGLKKTNCLVLDSKEITGNDNKIESCGERAFRHVLRNGATDSNPKIYANALIKAKNSEPSNVGIQHSGLDDGVALLMDRPYLIAIEKFKKAAQGLGCGLPEEEDLFVPGTPETALPLRQLRSVKCSREKLSYSIGEKKGCRSETPKGKEAEYTVLDVDCCSFCCNERYKEFCSK